MRRFWGAALDRDPYFSPNLVANEGVPGLSVCGIGAEVPI